MPSQEDAYKEQNRTKSSLKILQADLAESKKNYKSEEIKFNQFKMQASLLMKSNRHSTKTLPITFKKSKFSHSSQQTHTKA